MHAATVAHHLGGGGGSWGGAVRPHPTTAKAVWNTAVTNTTTAALDNLVLHLRQKLGAGGARSIVTIRNRGYAFTTFPEE